MRLIDLVFQEPGLKEAPPVLVDAGAAGGVTPIWRSVARYAIGVGFEPDAHDAGKLSEASRAFGRWIYCEGLVAPAVDGDKRKPFHLTQSPHCSSPLNADLLGQHGHGLMVANEGMNRFGGGLFAERAGRSGRRLRWSMPPKVPGGLRRRLGLGV